jgi:integrase/recombinase XerD
LPTKLTSTLSKIPTVPNTESAAIIDEFHRYMKGNGASEHHLNNSLKVTIAFAKFLGPNVALPDVEHREQVLAFLDTKIRTDDQEKRWITTWNDALRRLKMFYRWLHNVRLNTGAQEQLDGYQGWQTPAFMKIREKRSKRLSPYSETEIWDRDELLCVVKYATHIRNKAALCLFWDLDARNHEITLLKIKHIRLRENYGEGEIPHEAKTGGGPILLTCSFPYVRDWLNEHPAKNEPEAHIICNIYTGAPVNPEAMWSMFKHLRTRIVRLLKNGEITDLREREKLEYLLRTKKWNPYCLRHSAITNDSDFLPEFALKKKVRWSMNSKQGSRYIKRTIGNDLKREILRRNGITSDNEALHQTHPVTNCPRCALLNASENMYCAKCAYPLSVAAFEALKANESKDIRAIEERHRNEMDKFRAELLEKVEQIYSRIDINRLNGTKDVDNAVPTNEMRSEEADGDLVNG